MIQMVEVLEPLFLFYFLVLPMVVGMGIDSKIKNRYPYGASCGTIFFVVSALWMNLGIPGELAILEPIIVLTLAGAGMLFVGVLFEYKRPVSNVTRHALIFLVVAASGLPLYAIFRVIQGEMGFEYPTSVLPLFQFTLAVLGLVVLANVIAARLYWKNEGAERKLARKEEDLVKMKFKDMDELIIQREFDYPQGGRFPSSGPDPAFMRMDHESENLMKK